eukprot:3309603-Rhodomonas_salina.1
MILTAAYARLRKVDSPHQQQRAQQQHQHPMLLNKPGPHSRLRPSCPQHRVTIAGPQPQQFHWHVSSCSEHSSHDARLTDCCAAVYQDA